LDGALEWVSVADAAGGAFQFHESGEDLDSFQNQDFGAGVDPERVVFQHQFYLWQGRVGD